MTVGTTGNRFTYAGDGSTLDFAFPRPFSVVGDLRVILRKDAIGTETVQTIETDYQVAGAGQPAGGTVTMTSAPQTGETLVIVRRTEQKQETDYVTGGGFSAKSHEDALDRLTLMVQDLEEKVNRAVKLAETTPTPSAPTLPEPEARRYICRLGTKWAQTSVLFRASGVADLGMPTGGHADAVLTKVPTIV